MKITYPQLLKVIEKTNENDLLEVLRYIFSFKENIKTFTYFIFPNLISSESPKFHDEIYDFLFEEKNGAMAAPRGFAKSTVCGVFFISWCIVNKYKRFIVYMSQSHPKTVQFIDPIRNEFKHNERLRLLYGDLTPKGLKDDEGRDRQDLIEINGVRIQAVSFNKDIRGFKDKYGNRPDLIIGDDIDSMERLVNPISRKKDYDKLMKEVIPSLANYKSANFKMIGTILHWDSLLVNRVKHYGGKIYEACRFDKDGKIIPSSLLWPSYWSIERLIDKKKDIGSVGFSSEYLNNPIDNDSSIIKREWIMSCCDETVSYQDEFNFDETYLGVDFAFGDRTLNDKSAYVSVGTKFNEPHTIFSIKTFKGMSTTEQFKYIDNQNNTIEYDWVVMEENSIKSMTKELFNYSFNYYLIWTGNSDTADKLKPQIEFQNKRHSVSKRNMIMRLATQIENSNLRFPYKTEEDKATTNQLISELTTFALQDGKLIEVGVHADIPIALAMAVEKIAQSEEVIIST